MYIKMIFNIIAMMFVFTFFSDLYARSCGEGGVQQVQSVSQSRTCRNGNTSYWSVSMITGYDNIGPCGSVYVRYENCDLEFHDWMFTSIYGGHTVNTKDPKYNMLAELTQEASMSILSPKTDEKNRIELFKDYVISLEKNLDASGYLNVESFIVKDARPYLFYAPK